MATTRGTHEKYMRGAASRAKLTNDLVEAQHPASGWVMTGHARFRLVSLRSTLWSCCC
jgi:hypothetical protein